MTAIVGLGWHAVLSKVNAASSLRMSIFVVEGPQLRFHFGMGDLGFPVQLIGSH